MKITKKNGNITVYDDQKVVRSILNANAGTPLENISQTVAEALADDVFSQLRQGKSAIACMRRCSTGATPRRRRDTSNIRTETLSPARLHNTPHRG